MKTRLTFVSNSSSSSYIIKTKNDNCIVSIDLKKLCNARIIKSEDDLDKYYINEYGEDELEFIKEDGAHKRTLRALYKAQKEGKYIVLCNLEYWNDGIINAVVDCDVIDLN